MALTVDRVAIHDQNDAALVLLLQTHCEALAPTLLDGVAHGENLQGLCAFSGVAQLFSVPQGQERRVGAEHVMSPLLRDNVQNLVVQAGEIS